MSTPNPPAPDPWPPLWARKVGFAFGLALIAFEAVDEHSKHYALYGVGFILTGLPIARGLDRLIELLQGLKGKP